MNSQEKHDIYNYEKEHSAIVEMLHQITEGVVVYCDLEMMMARITDDIIGLAIGEEGPYFNQQELRNLFVDVVKNPVGENRYAKYENVDIRISAPGVASLRADVHLHLTIDGQEITSSYIQLGCCRKDNGIWKLFFSAAVPLGLTQESIEALPLKFADNALAALKAELQTDTFDLMNQSFSGGIIGMFTKEPHPLYFANDSFINMLGYERTEFEDKFKDSVETIFHPEEQTHVAEIVRMKNEGTKDAMFRTRLLKKDGDIVWVELRTRKTKDDADNDIFLSVAVDVSEIVNLQIETKEQHETIMAGIEYASKIQTDLLPSDNAMRKAFSDYSVIWKPRDVVGGDIYWMKQFDTGTVLCVVDCTGHGTSGALLTMLVVSAFEAEVTEQNYTDTAEIMWLLEKRLVNVFGLKDENRNVSGNNIQDGCDLAVLFIANDGNVTLSAGNTNVFVCDGKTVNRIRGQRLYVGEGKIQNKDKIKTVHIPSNPDNKFYIASDGLSDQSGFESDEPFGYRTFNEIVLANHNLTMSEITDIVWEAFEKHRGNMSRLDDFELVAFKP